MSPRGSGRAPHLSHGDVPRSLGASAPELQGSPWSLPATRPSPSGASSGPAPHRGGDQGNIPRSRAQGCTAVSPPPGPARPGPLSLPLPRGANQPSWRTHPRGLAATPAPCASPGHVARAPARLPRAPPGDRAVNSGYRGPPHNPATRVLSDTVTPEGHPEGFWLLFIAADATPATPVVFPPRPSVPEAARPAGQGGPGPGCPHRVLVSERGAQARLLLPGSQAGWALPPPSPLRPVQQGVDDSSDVGEAPSRGPLLFQDVVGLAQ